MMKRPRADTTDDIDWPYGDRFMVYHPQYLSWYLGKVSVVDAKARKVRIRYAGWGEEDDEWIDVNSDR